MSGGGGHGGHGGGGSHASGHGGGGHGGGSISLGDGAAFAVAAIGAGVLLWWGIFGKPFHLFEFGVAVELDRQSLVDLEGGLEEMVVEIPAKIFSKDVTMPRGVHIEDRYMVFVGSADFATEVELQRTFHEVALVPTGEWYQLDESWRQFRLGAPNENGVFRSGQVTLRVAALDRKVAKPLPTAPRQSHH